MRNDWKAGKTKSAGKQLEEQNFRPIAKLFGWHSVEQVIQDNVQLRRESFALNMQVKELKIKTAEAGARQEEHTLLTPTQKPYPESADQGT